MLFKSLTTVFIAIVIFFNLNGTEYKASLIGTELMSGIGLSVEGINDKGQIFGGYTDINKSKHIMYIYDRKYGLTLIEEKCSPYNYLNPNNSVINNASQVVGQGGSTEIYIWSNLLGFHPLSICNSNNVIPIDLNDLGQIIGTYYDDEDRTHKPFLWDNGVITEMGVNSEFAKNFESLGYHVTDIQLKSINNRGELAGFFQYGKYNEKKKTFVAVGYKPFFWDGIPHILPLPYDTEFPARVVLNNKGVVLVRYRIFDRINDRDITTTYLWDIENGIKELSDFHGSRINDSSVVVGRKIEYNQIGHRREKEIPMIWRNGKFITFAELLGVSDVENMAPPYSDTYAIEKIRTGSFKINNKGQIACYGYMWGEWHPCILEP